MYRKSMDQFDGEFRFFQDDFYEPNYFTNLAIGNTGKNFSDAIKLFEGIFVNPFNYPKSLNGFQNYLDDTGVIFFSAKEMTTPKNKSIASKYGYKVFLPKQEWWPRGAALAKLADFCRTHAASPVRMRNWWRPKGYNEAVGGKSQGDHPTAHGIDLDYKTIYARRGAESFLKFYQSHYPWLEMSLGLGYRTTHIGIMSPRGRRTWKYKSYKP